MLDIIQSLMFGGATGILGTSISSVIKIVQARQRHVHEVEFRRIDLEIAREEARSAERVAAIEAESAAAEAEAEALRASFDQETTRLSKDGDHGIMLAVDVVRGLLRPGLTITFLALTAWIYASLGDGDVELRDRIIDTILYLTTTCTIWWFGGRMIDKRPAG